MYLKHEKITLIWRILILISTLYGIYGGVYLGGGTPDPYSLLYYTIQSNLWCFLLYLYLVIKMLQAMNAHQKVPSTLVSTWLKGGITTAIIITFLIYQFLIVPYCLKNGAMHQIFSPADIAVHYLTPFLVVVDYLLCDTKKCYNWKTPFQWLTIPFIYFSYIVVRTFFNRPVPEPQHPYLYFFLDLERIGVASFIHNLVGIGLIFITVGYLVVVINHLGTYAK